MFDRLHTRTFKILAVALLLLLFPASLPAAESDETDSNIPPKVEQALGNILAAAPANATVSQADINTLLQFVVSSERSKEKIRLAKREHGTSAFLRQRLNIPLKDVLAYLVDPRIPSALLYPTSIRNNSWQPDSQILNNWKTFVNSPLPPEKPLVMHGLEKEETTPDTSSGCTYSYELQRLFVLTSINGRSALVTVSVMPKESSYGHKGALISDKDWSYMYSSEIGTGLPMLGWAKTNLYGSAGILVYMEDAPGSSKTTLSVFKWTKAGWSGMNAVKTSHVTEGIKRFIAGMRQVLESPRRPSPDALAAEYARLKKLDDAALRASIAPFVEKLKTTDCDALDDKPFSTLLEQGYAESLSRKGLMAEALRVYLRNTLKP